MPVGAGEGSGLRFLPRKLADRALLEAPCGTCQGCRIANQQQWAIRCTHEAQLHKQNSFVTFTFDDASLLALEAMDPYRPHHSVDLRDMQTLFKRLRKEKDIRYMQTAEYGGQFHRPHYHALIFGADWREDRQPCREPDPNGNPYWVSPSLAKLWPHGEHRIGLLTPETTSYVCSYTLKKITGKMLEESARYERVSADTGECWKVNPEFTTMSRRPGIGRAWFERFQSDVFPGDVAIINGKKKAVPNYYVELLKNKDPKAYQLLKKRRHKATAGRAADNTTKRRLVKEQIAEAKSRAAKLKALD